MAGGGGGSRRLSRSRCCSSDSSWSRSVWTRSPTHACGDRCSALPEQALPNALRAYRNREWGYSLPRPDVWSERDLDVEGGQGVIFAPDPLELRTAISVEVRDLGVEVTAEDLPDLEKAFLKGLRSVPGSRIERHEAFEGMFHIGLEA